MNTGMAKRTILASLILLSLPLLAATSTRSNCPVSGGSPQIWDSIGPPGGSADSLVVDPFQTTAIFAASSWGGGVYRTDWASGVTSWKGCGLTDDQVTGLAASPTQPGRLYASTLYGGIFRTDDEG